MRERKAPRTPESSRPVPVPTLLPDGAVAGAVVALQSVSGPPGAGWVWSPSQVLALQRAVGNAAVSRLTCGDDQESGVGIEGDGERLEVQRSAVLDVLNTPGRPLGGRLLADMETRFGGEDFSAVRLHTGAAARRSAEAVEARAFTSGNHIVSAEGDLPKNVLAHELGHVRQQRLGPVPGTDRGNGLQVSDPSDRAEQEAERTARQVMTGPVPVERVLLAGSTPGSPAANRMSIQRVSQGGSQPSASQTGKEKTSAAANAAADRAVDVMVEKLEECHCTETGVAQQGIRSRNVTKRFPRGFKSKKERVHQTMRHASIRLLNCVRYLEERGSENYQSDSDVEDLDAGQPAEGKRKPFRRSESEVQCMFMNGRFVFAANFNRSINFLQTAMEQLGRQEEADADEMQGVETHGADVEMQDVERAPIGSKQNFVRLMQLGPSSQSGEEKPGKSKAGKSKAGRRKGRAYRARAKIGLLLRGKRVNDAAEVLKGDGRVWVVDAQPDTDVEIDWLADLLLGDNYRGDIILLKHDRSKEEVVHAEQKLVMALESIRKRRDMPESGIEIRGTKRPCAACWSLLEWTRKQGYPLDSNPNFGTFTREAGRSLAKYLPQSLILSGNLDETRTNYHAEKMREGVIEKGGMFAAASRGDIEKRRRGEEVDGSTVGRDAADESESDSDVDSDTAEEIFEENPAPNLSALGGLIAGAEESKLTGDNRELFRQTAEPGVDTSLYGTERENDDDYLPVSRLQHEMARNLIEDPAARVTPQEIEAFLWAAPGSLMAHPRPQGRGRRR